MKEKRVVQMTITDRAARVAIGCAAVLTIVSAGPARAASLQSVIAGAGDLLDRVGDRVGALMDVIVGSLTRTETDRLQLALIGFSAVIAVVALWLLLRRPPANPGARDDVLDLVYPLPDLSSSPPQDAAPRRPRLREAVAAMKAEMAQDDARGNRAA